MCDSTKYTAVSDISTCPVLSHPNQNSYYYVYPLFIVEILEEKHPVFAYIYNGNVH